MATNRTKAERARKPAATTSKKPTGSRAKPRAQASKGRTVDAQPRTRSSSSGGKGRADRGGEGYAMKPARDMAIMAANAAGRSAKEIGAQFGITEQSVRRLIREYGTRRTALEQPPMGIVEGALRVYESQLETWSALLVDLAGKPEQRHLMMGALRGYSEVFERRMGALAALGKLPDNLEVFRMESELARLGQLVLSALDDVAGGKVAAVEARDRVKELVSRRELPLIEATAR